MGHNRSTKTLFRKTANSCHNCNGNISWTQVRCHLLKQKTLNAWQSMYLPPCIFHTLSPLSSKGTQNHSTICSSLYNFWMGFNSSVFLFLWWQVWLGHSLPRSQLNTQNKPVETANYAYLQYRNNTLNTKQSSFWNIRTRIKRIVLGKISRIQNFGFILIAVNQKGDLFRNIQTWVTQFGMVWELQRFYIIWTISIGACDRMHL